jgi:cytochrome c
MSSSMPQGNPGSLSDQEYIDILAYMMSQNRYATGEKELQADTNKLNTIVIESRKR